MFFTRVAPRTKSQGVLIGGPLLSKKLMFSTRVAPRTKSQGLSIGGPLLSKNFMLFTRVAPRTKSNGALDQRSTDLLLLLAHASSRTKIKGLHRYVLQVYYFINQDTSRI
jgi:hypothetical protein